MEATQLLKPLVKLAMNWWHRECAGRNAVNAEQTSKRAMHRRPEHPIG